MAKTILTALLIFVCFNFFDVLSQTDSSVKLSNAGNCFNVDLYKQLITAQENVVCSPYGAFVVLSMLLVGAQGTTAEELNKTLGYSNPPLLLTEMEDAFKTNLASQKSSGGNTLIVANSLWIQKGKTLKEDYHDIVTKDFYATEQSLDFAGDPDDSTNTINDWVNSQTKGLIPKLFDKPLQRSTLLVLVNTIYFQAFWERPFDKQETQNNTFFNNGKQDEPVLIPFMNQENVFNYQNYTSLKAQVLEMDYKGGDLSMVLILPYENSSLDKLEAALDCSSFKDGFHTPSASSVLVSIPLFTVESSFELNNELENLGLKTLFQNGADLTGISPEIYISEIIQKAVIKVKENGTEAAAATAAVGATGGQETPQITFKANRPFVYMLRHNPTNIILFMGRVTTFNK